MIDASSGEAGRRKTEYALFLWRVNKAIPAIRALYDQAIAASPRGLGDVDLSKPARHLDLGEYFPSLLHAASVYVRDDIQSVVQHGCAGAILQIAQTLFDGYLDAIGVPRSKSAFGPDVSGVPFSQALWAARGSYVHGDDWRRRAAGNLPPDRRSEKQIDTLKKMGVAEPSRSNAFNLLTMLINHGDIDELRRRLIAAAKVALDYGPVKPSAPSRGQWDLLPELNALFWTGVVTAVAALLESFLQRGASRTVTAGFVISGIDEVILVDIASPQYESRAELRKALREIALEGLPGELAQVHRDFERFSEQFGVRAAAIAELDPESPAFTSELFDFFAYAEELHQRNIRLTDPLSELADLRLSGREDRGLPAVLHAFVADLLAANGIDVEAYVDRNASAPIPSPPSTFSASDIFGDDTNNDTQVDTEL
jgi:hypothetical protein